ncbi:11824_t:CDS:2 [Acaulospora colombiana]|uniref:11824_t:CDS:1 n=1 Tax=Acaulospora colombiana TaxID=27376 RepID=A0ACA9LHF6_9GLOM|nr:11824_t:CDS:2 [Acaulospora colombiana]
MELKEVRSVIRKLRRLFTNYRVNYEEIKKLAESNPTSKIIPHDLSTLNSGKPSGIHLDKGACFLLPPQYQAEFECLKAKEDGNCLFNSVSIILMGTEDLSTHLRLAVLCELIKYSKHYLSLDEFKKAITYSDKALDEGDSAPPEMKHEVRYFAQIREMCDIGAWCTLLAIYGLSSVLERPINSIFPPVRNSLYEETFSRRIEPRILKNKGEIKILWTNVSVIDAKTASVFLDELAPSCNHFVPVFPKEATGIQIYTKKRIKLINTRISMTSIDHVPQNQLRSLALGNPPLNLNNNETCRNK